VYFLSLLADDVENVVAVEVVEGDVGDGVAVPLELRASLGPEGVGLSLVRPNVFGFDHGGVGAAPRVVVLAQSAAVCARTPETSSLLCNV